MGHSFISVRWRNSGLIANVESAQLHTSSYAAIPRQELTMRERRTKQKESIGVASGKKSSSLFHNTFSFKGISRTVSIFESAPLYFDMALRNWPLRKASSALDLRPMAICIVAVAS